MNQNEIVLLATNHAQRVVGAQDHRTVKNLAKSAVVLSATKAGALELSLGNAVIFFVLQDVLVQNNQIAW
jgi:hypothetical protein